MVDSSAIHKKILHILFVIESPYPWPIGGTERQARRLAQQLKGQDCHIKFITPQARCFRDQLVYDDRQPIQRLGIPVAHEHPLFKRLFYGRLVLYLFAHRREYDIVHLHLLGTTAFITSLARWLKKVSVMKITCRDHWEFLKSKEKIWHIRFVFRRSLRHLDLFIVPSRYLRKILINDGIPAEKVHYIPNGIDQIDLPTNPRFSRLRLGLPLDESIILFAGRFIPVKNIPYLLSGFQALLEKGLSGTLVLLGEGPLRAELKDWVNKAGLSAKILFPGLVANVREYMQASDIFVISSHREGCPNVLLEAMSCGRSCVATRFEGSAEIIRSGQNGFLVSHRQPDELTEILIRLIRDDGLREQLGAAARETVRQHFHIEHVAQKHKDIYRRLKQNISDVGNNACTN